MAGARNQVYALLPRPPRTTTTSSRLFKHQKVSAWLVSADNSEEREHSSEITDSSARANEFRTERNLRRMRRRGWQRWAVQNHRSGQASSASAERLFGDARYQEGTRRQVTGSPVTEVLLVVRSYVVAHLKSPSRQTGFVSNRAQAVKELAEAIARELEEWNDLNTFDYANDRLFGMTN